MAGAERVAVSAITASSARAAHNPVRNYRPAFEDIMLSGKAPDVPQRLSEALGSLVSAAREKGVEDKVDHVLRMYASEIKNDIVLLTINRLRDLVQSLPKDRLEDRLGQIPQLMREFPQAADTVPQLVLDAERMHGGSRLGLEPMRGMMRAVVGRAGSLCPKALFAEMKSGYESGGFDRIPGVAEARGAKPADAFLVQPLYPNPIADNASQPGAAQPPASATSEAPFLRIEKVWCDEVKLRKRTDEQPQLVFESIETVVRKNRGGEQLPAIVLEKGLDVLPERAKSKNASAPGKEHGDAASAIAPGPNHTRPARQVIGQPIGSRRKDAADLRDSPPKAAKEKPIYASRSSEKAPDIRGLGASKAEGAAVEKRGRRPKIDAHEPARKAPQKIPASQKPRVSRLIALSASAKAAFVKARRKLEGLKPALLAKRKDFRARQAPANQPRTEKARKPRKPARESPKKERSGRKTGMETKRGKTRRHSVHSPAPKRKEAHDRKTIVKRAPARVGEGCSYRIRRIPREPAAKARRGKRQALQIAPFREARRPPVQLTNSF